jgi:hypothetical protein
MAPHSLLAALAAFRFAAPSVLLLIVLALLQVRPSKEPPSSPSPITPVMVPQVVPRRTAILTFISFLSLLYFASAGLVILRAVLAGVWVPPFPYPREWNTSLWAVGPDVLGFLVFATLALILTWKDVNGISVWGRRRVKATISLATLATFVEIALIVAVGGLKPKPAPPA